MNNVVKRIAIAALAILAMSAGFYFSQTSLKDSEQAVSPAPAIPGILWPNPKQLSEFQLTDHNNQPFNLSRLKDKWSLVFFGYSHCPDVCPGTITMLNTVINGLEKDQQLIPQVIFVSVDPERDTLEHLSDYISYFNRNFIAVTGNEENLQGLTGQLGILAMKIKNEEATDVNDYLMDHSASILLIGPDAELLGIFSAPHDPENIQKRYNQITEFIKQNHASLIAPSGA